MKAKVYLLSIGQVKRIAKDFPSFLVAELTQKAEKKLKIPKDKYNRGSYFLRTFINHDTDVPFVYYDGTIGKIFNQVCIAGLRVSLMLDYNPESEVVKSCKPMTKVAQVYNAALRMETSVISTAPVVEFDKKQFVWLNKTDCENKTATKMELVSLQLLDRSFSFGEAGTNTNFEKAKEILAQCEQQFSPKALNQIVPVEMSIEDNFESVTPISTKTKNSSGKDREK